MKQFYETYAVSSACFSLWLSTKNSIVPPLASQLNHDENIIPAFVSPPATQMQDADKQHNYFITSVLSQLSWTNHLEIFSSIKNPEQLLFYLLMSAREKWSKLELRRQIQSAAFERTMLVNKMISALPVQLPENIFKDPLLPMLVLSPTYTCMLVVSIAHLARRKDVGDNTNIGTVERARRAFGIHGRGIDWFVLFYML